MLAELGFIGTIGENDEVPVEPESDSGDEEEEVGTGGGRNHGRERPGMSCELSCANSAGGVSLGSCLVGDTCSRVSTKPPRLF